MHLISTHPTCPRKRCPTHALPDAQNWLPAIRSTVQPTLGSDSPTILALQQLATALRPFPPHAPALLCKMWGRPLMQRPLSDTRKGRMVTVLPSYSLFIPNPSIYTRLPVSDRHLSPYLSRLPITIILSPDSSHVSRHLRTAMGAGKLRTLLAQSSTSAFQVHHLSTRLNVEASTQRHCSPPTRPR